MIDKIVDAIHELRKNGLTPVEIRLGEEAASELKKHPMIGSGIGEEVSPSFIVEEDDSLDGNEIIVVSSEDNFKRVLL